MKTPLTRTPIKHQPQAGRPAFTLVELLIAIAVVSVLVVLIAQVVNSALTTWQNSRERVNATQEARNGFDRLRATLAKAAFDTRFEYVDSSGNPRDPTDPNFIPTGLARNADLHFVSGPAATLIPGGGATSTPGQAVFFQAPLGVVSDPTLNPLSNLLNPTGFHVEFSDLSSSLPGFLQNTTRQQSRFRLMQWVHPSDQSDVYEVTRPDSTRGALDWFQDFLPTSPGSAPPSGPAPRVLAEDVFALFILPKVSPSDETTLGGPVSPDFSYDSRAWKNNPLGITGSLGGIDRTEATRNQLPPYIEVAAFALERSQADRLYRAAGGSPPPQLAVPTDLFNNSSSFDADIKEFERRLIEENDPPIRARVFRATIPVQAAKWSNP